MKRHSRRGSAEALVNAVANEKVRFKLIFEKVQVSNRLSNAMRQCFPESRSWNWETAQSIVHGTDITGTRVIVVTYFDTSFSSREVLVSFSSREYADILRLQRLNLKNSLKIYINVYCIIQNHSVYCHENFQIFFYICVNFKASSHNENICTKLYLESVSWNISVENFHLLFHNTVFLKIFKKRPF